ncbi:MAG: hypothetical protein GF330_11690 [Candidatus Eisenbacteria bacterium]|nr:hypothetical protein [Candidatus Eisenbacteria bacterium]
MPTRRASRSRLQVPRPGPLLIAFLAGGALVLLALGLSGRVRWNAPAQRETPVTAGVPVDPETTAALLAAVLEPQADWERHDASPPLQWRGRVAAEESLVQWNARVSALCERLGLQIVSGTEEIIERRGRWPLQRVTLVAALAGETLATLVVEAPRPPTVPPAF